MLVGYGWRIYVFNTDNHVAQVEITCIARAFDYARASVLCVCAVQRPTTSIAIIMISFCHSERVHLVPAMFTIARVWIVY